MSITNRLRIYLFAAWLSLSAAGLSAQTDVTLQPFTIDHRKALRAHLPVDVSFLLDAPAGKHGFVRAQGGHLVAADGKRIRFWGMNVTGWSKGSVMVPSKEAASLWAATLARFGVNCVRFQFLDLPTPRGLIDGKRDDTRALDPEQFDREDFFIAELKKRGIYINFNLLVGRLFKPGDAVQDYQELREGAKGISLYDPRIIELQKEYARQLLAHYNPYTKSEYRNDPAVAMVEINNENALWVGAHGPTPYYDRELEDLYNRWLGKNLDAEDLKKLRELAGVSGDAPVPLLQGSAQIEAAPKKRFDAESRFFLDAERGYFEDMRDYLATTLGVKSLIVATADHSHVSSGYPLLLATSSFATTDGHTYWQHDWKNKVKAPMVNDPYNSTVVELSRTAVAGKPYTVSEVNNPFPNDWASEGIPILAAYGDGNLGSMNIKEVAARARLSTATVSRTINQSELVRPRTAEKVQRAIRELGYYPNTQARALVSGRSQMFGLIISDIVNPFFPELVKSFEFAAIHRGYEVIVANTDYDSERMSGCVRRMIERKVDGVAIMTSEIDRHLLDELSHRRLPIVFLDVGKLKPLISNIKVDYSKGIGEAVQHIVSLGHERIGFISGPLTLKSARTRRSAFLKCIDACGIGDRQRSVVEGNHKMDGGYVAMAQLLALPKPPTAVLTSNDLTAIGALHAITRVDLRVPDDISVIGFDDIQLSQFTQPPLTTIRLSRDELGRRAFDLLYETVQGQHRSGQEIKVSTGLVLRESTAPVKVRCSGQSDLPAVVS